MKARRRPCQTARAGSAIALRRERPRAREKPFEQLDGVLALVAQAEAACSHWWPVLLRYSGTEPKAAAHRRRDQAVLERTRGRWGRHQEFGGGVTGFAGLKRRRPWWRMRQAYESIFSLPVGGVRPHAAPTLWLHGNAPAADHKFLYVAEPGFAITRNTADMAYWCSTSTRVTSLSAGLRRAAWTPRACHGGEGDLRVGGDTAAVCKHDEHPRMLRPRLGQAAVGKALRGRLRPDGHIAWEADLFAGV